MRIAAALLAILTLGTAAPQMPEDERLGRQALGLAARALRVDSLPRMWMIEGHGRENLSAEIQGRNPDEPTWRPHHEWVAVDRQDDTVGWRRWTPRNDDSIRDRAFVYGPSRTLVVDHANGFERETEGDVPAARRRALMRRVPHLLIADIVSRSATTVRGGQALPGMNGSRSYNVEVGLPGGERMDLNIADSGVLRGASYRLNVPPRREAIVSWVWHDWKPHATLGFIPARHSIEIDWVRYQDVAYTRYEAADSIFDAHNMLRLPGVFASPMTASTRPPAWTAAAGPDSGEVAPGVHVARMGGFTILFADIGASIVAFEAPEPALGFESIPATNRELAGTLTPQIIAHIRKTIPGKPISHVVISHHHGDHADGTAAFAAAGAKIVTSETRIGEGDREIQVINVGPNPHTDDNLVLWMPAQGVMIQGDLFYFDAGRGFQAGRHRMNRFFAGWLRARGIRPRMLYGVHNTGAAGPAALDQLR